METFKTALGYYLLIVNVLAFLLMVADKIKAIYKKRRISEACLLAVAVIGGSIGGLFSMYIFNHKTNHKKFLIGLPLLAVIHIVLYIIYFKSFLI